MTRPLPYDVVLKALAEGDICYDMRNRIPPMTGEIGDRQVEYEAFGIDRDALSSSFLLDSIQDETGLTGKALLRRCVRDDEGTEVQIMVGSLDHDASWALLISAYVPPHPEAEANVDIKLIESPEHITRVIHEHENEVIANDAEKIMELITRATKLGPKKLLALRRVLGELEGGSKVFGVWDAMATEAGLEKKTKPAKKMAKPGSGRL